MKVVVDVPEELDRQKKAAAAAEKLTPVWRCRLTL
jgi:hypothetical protein